jgi:hypothetical protein
MDYGKMQYAKDIKEMSLFQMISEKSDAQNVDASDEGLEAIYTWVDTVPVSRPKRNIQRDFADGSLLAQIIHYYLPKSQKSLVQTHNYIETMNKDKKLNNWDQLNKKVICKFNGL